jgi:hypothetical protein
MLFLLMLEMLEGPALDAIRRGALEASPHWLEVHA